MKLNNSNDKVCIIFPGNIFTTPFLKRYTDVLENAQVKYDYVYWNVMKIEERSGACNSYVLDYKITPLDHPIRKFLGYYKFFHLASRVIKKNNYKRIICLTSVPAVMLCNILVKKYRGRYIVDIRDYYMERKKLFYLREKRAIENSGISVISSPGYKVFLPKYDYCIAHNVNWLSANELSIFADIHKGSKKTLQLSYVGNMRFIDSDKKLLSFFANDERFHINMCGRGYSALRKFCNDNEIANVTIVDWFPPEKTLYYYQNADMILNLYGNGSPTVDYALSNKLYYATQLHKPIIVCPDTYMEEIADRYGVGFTFDYNDELIKDKLYEYYNTLSWNTFNSGCEKFLADIRIDDELFESRLNDFVIRT